MISDRLKYLIDFCIGDGHISYYDSRRSYIYKLEHSIKQKDYFLHKCTILENLGFSGRYNEYIKILNGKEYKTLCFVLHIDDDIKSAYKWIINKGHKEIDNHLLSIMDDRTLAYWFMDDGSSNKISKSSSLPGNGYRYYYTYPVVKIQKFSLYTYQFSYKTQELITDWLYNKFNILANIQRSNRDGYYIDITKMEQKQRFIDVIKKYIIPSMQYKINGLLSYKDIKPISIYRKRLNENAPLNKEDDATVQGTFEPAKSNQEEN